MDKPRLVTRKKTPSVRAPHCKMTRGVTKWCYGICSPVRGVGACGRPAWFVLRGRTQRAIARYLRDAEMVEAQEDGPEAGRAL